MVLTRPVRTPLPPGHAVSWKDLKRGVLPDAYRLEDKLKRNSSQPLPGTPK